MFSVQHFIWLFVCTVVIVGTILLLKKYRPSLTKVLIGCFCVAAASQLFIILSEIELVPSQDGKTLRLFLPYSSLPLHMCSIQIFLIGIAIFLKKHPLRETLLAFMYATGAGGAFMAMVVATIFNSVSPEKSFTYPRAYEYFIYHSMLIIMGAYIYMSGEVRFKPKHILTTFLGLFGLAWSSIHINSILSVPHYENGKLISVDYNTNFFFTFEPPIDVALTERWHWYVYLLILLGVVLIFEAILFIPPILIQKGKNKALFFSASEH